MAMQCLTDIGYSGLYPDEENEFVVAGPGAHRGAKAIGMKADDAFRWAHEQFWGDLIGTPLIDLGNGRTRALSLLDIQNTFCEYSKFVRYMNKPPRTNPFSPAHPGPQPPIVYPRHW